MKRSILKIVIAAMLVLFFVSCENAENGTKDQNDLDETESPDVMDTDEEGNFVTAGSGEEGDQKGGDGDYGNGDDAAPEAGDDSAGDPEREIVESDIYKIQGDTIWVVNRYKGLIAIDMSKPEKLKIVGKAPFQGMPGEMYLQEGRAYILVTGLSGKNLETEDEGYWENRQMSKVIVVNTEKPSDPKIIGSYDMDGTIVDSRQVGDVIYVAATQYRYYWYWCDSMDEYGKDQITLMSLNVADPKDIKKVDEVSLEGTAYTIYVSKKSIYIAEANYDYWNDDHSKNYPVTLFDISDPDGKIEKKAVFETEGFMSDRWKMYEKGDVFFAVSSSSRWGNGTSMIESFDVSDPEKIERLDKLVFMEDQQLYGTKFEGDRMYAVTYFQQDPLHVIDISDPENIIELGFLEIPGWSTHLEIRGDKILAVGIDDADGWKTKVSMYDVADPENPTEMSMIAIGSNYSWSEANYDWKAFKIYDELGLILLPVNEYEERTWRSIYKLYLIDFDMEKGLTQRGHVVSDSPVMRGVAVDEKIVSIGDRHVMIIDAKDRDNPEILSTAVLAYYVGDLNTCGNQLCGIDNNWYSNPSTLVTYNPGDDVDPVKWRSDPLSKDNYYGYSNLLKSGDKGYVFSNIYWYYDYGDELEGSETRDYSRDVKIFKFENDVDPLEIGSVKLQPPEMDSDKHYYSFYNAQVSSSGALAFVNQDWDYYYPENDCYNSEDDCKEKGDGYSIYKASLYIYDLSDPKKEKVEPVTIETEGRALDWDTKIVVNENTFWFTDCKRKGLDEKGRELLYCYAVPVDVKDPSKPVVGKKVNIPGKVIGISDDGDYLYTSHLAWKNEDIKEDSYYYGRSYIKTLYILKLNSDRTKVSVVKKISVPNSWESTEETYRYEDSSFITKNDKVFIGTYVTVYNYERNDCSYWYYSNRERKVRAQIFNASDGKKIYDKEYENGGRFESVANGGFLVSIENAEDNHYYGHSDSNQMVYISTEGAEKDITLTEKTYGYYSYSTASSVIGDYLYVARDWNGIEKISLK
jgi:uncharacterized secreted protein with C-terminal beta-propeller domain